jgi:multicomponent K+:H+ antiporter subunit A
MQALQVPQSLFVLLALPFAAAALLVLLPRVGLRAAAWIAGGAAALALLLLLAHAGPVVDGSVPQVRIDWLPTLGLALSLRLDGFAWMFAFVVLSIGVLVVVYARWYLGPGDGARRFFALLALFMGAMLGITLAGNLLLLLVFWELTSIVSFLLVGFRGERADARAGARMALVVTGGGGLALLAGVLLIGGIVGSFELDAVLAAGDAIRAHALYVPALVLVLVGAFAKSAQFPLHFWLPQAMAAPTPVSAYLHSATMVKAGVFLLARLHPALAGTETWFWIVVPVGLATLLVGASLALVQQDIKGLLAYSTISHLGLITLLFGLDTELAVVAGLFHILNHATFKASLFMAAGIIDHETGSRDFRRLNGLWKFMPITGALAIVASLSMAGVPLLNGFLSKEMFLAETLAVDGHAVLRWVVPAISVLAGMLAVAYSLRFVHDVFFNGEPVDLPRVPHEPPRFLRVPVEILVALCLAVGVLPQYTIAPLLALGVQGVLQGEVPAYKVAIWHGLNLPLVLSAVGLAGGIALYFGLQRGVNLHRIERHSIGPRAFEAALRGLLALSRRVTRALENGSLQRYLLLLVLAALVLGAAPLLEGGPGAGSAASTPVGVFDVLALVLVVAGVAGTLRWYRERVVAVVLVGVVGLGVSLLFVQFSAPDLALTQLLVEMASVLLILLALRFLPQRSPPERGRTRALLHAAVAGACGLGVGLLVHAVLTRPTRSISDFFLRETLPAGGGANAVNVIIVDFRGFDTLGEIAVFGIAGLILHALLRGRLAEPGVDAKSPPEGRRRFLLQVAAQLLLPLSIAVALHLFLRGHNAPGGGFIAGLVLALGIALQALANGRTALGPADARTWRAWIGWGLVVAVLSGVGSFVFGHPFLTSSTPHVHLPLVGELHLASATAFDTGVFLVVTGTTVLMLSMLARLGVARRNG